MKLKSLILGSVAAAGLSTGAYAADLGVLTSLDVCDALGLSGLTISSDTNCLQITGHVEYKFVWGDYADAGGDGQYIVETPDDVFSIPLASGVGGADQDWTSYAEAYIKFVATADSDFGPAKAVLKLRQRWEEITDNETDDGLDDPEGDTEALNLKEAYVSIGDSTVIIAGKTSSLLNDGDDEPFNWLGLFNSENVDTGVNWSDSDYVPVDGGFAIQVVSDLGNGISVGAGLENLEDDNSTDLAGTAIGVISYAGEGLSAHVSLLAGGILDGEVEAYAIHAGFTGTFDQFRVRGAFAANNDTVNNVTTWQALASAEASFDMFKLAASAEASRNVATQQGFGLGASASATVTDGVTINLGGRWFDTDTAVTDNEGYQIAASLSAAVTETLTLTGEVGVYGENFFDTTTYYGSAQVAWAPGGGFTSSLKGEAYSNGAYKATFKAAKSFE